MVDHVESTYTPINGAEAKKALKSNTSTRIDSIAGFKLGLAFHKLKIEYTMKATAYPADVPVPEAEFAFIINSPDLEKQSEILEHFDKIEILEAKRERLLEGIAMIDKILDIARPIYNLKETLSAGDAPDELRIAEGLPVPMIKTGLGGRKSEVYIEAGVKNA